jgi:hypothetical protein
LELAVNYQHADKRPTWQSRWNASSRYVLFIKILILTITYLPFPLTLRRLGERQAFLVSGGKVWKKLPPPAFKIAAGHSVGLTFASKFFFA